MPIKSIFMCEDGGELICYSCSTLIHFHAFANQLLQLMVKISCAQSNLKTFTSRCARPKHALLAPSNQYSYGFNNFQLTIKIWLVLTNYWSGHGRTGQTRDYALALVKM